MIFHLLQVMLSGLKGSDDDTLEFVLLRVWTFKPSFIFPNTTQRLGNVTLFRPQVDNSRPKEPNWIANSPEQS
jgi:hypothetical protein